MNSNRAVLNSPPKTQQNIGFIKNIFLFPLKPQHTIIGYMEANITDECLFSLNSAIILISLPVCPQKSDEERKQG